MAACLTDAELSALTLETGPSPLQPAQQEHLLGCEGCRARLLDAFRHNARVTDPGGARGRSLDETAPSTPSDKDSLDEDVPLSMGRYVLHEKDGVPELLGRGGYGKVLLARDVAVGRDVALKCLRSGVLNSPKRAQVEARLLREARVVGQLEHPAIVPLYDVGRTPEGRLFYTMRRIRGRTLAEVVAASPDFAARLRLLPHVLTACHAIAYAHSRGVIHRDLKPQNVMVDRFGQTAVIDWGLAATRGAEHPDEPDASDAALRLMGRQDTLSDGKGRVGTPAYMSPEQLTGVRGLIDEKSDVWGLGAMLFEVLTGRSPRDRGPLHQPPPAVRTLVPECPTDLAALCDKALAEAREARYPSAEALAEDLDAWLHGREVKAHVYRPRELIKRFVTEHRVALTVGLVSLLTLVVLSATAFVRVREERNRARDFGLSMLSDVLPRVTSLGDTAFLSRFTGRVQEWLDVAGSGSDDPSVGRAWMRLAFAAEAADDERTARRFAERCLLLARGLPDGRDRYGLEQACEALLLSTNWSVPAAERGDSIEQVWKRPPPPGADDDVFTLEARSSVATRRFLDANVNGQLDREQSASADSVWLARRWLALSPADPLARLALGDALEAEAIARTNRHDTSGALRASGESLKEARTLLNMMRTEQALIRLSHALLIEVSTRRWYLPADEARAALEREARAVFDALLVLSPRSSIVLGNLLQLLLETAQLEGLGTVLEQIDPARMPPDGRGLWSYAMVAAGRSRVLLDQYGTVDRDSTGIDAWLGLSLAAATTGAHQQAAAWARIAAQQTTASQWGIDGMHRWAASQVGPEGELIKALDAAMGSALRRGDDQAMRDAITTFADGLERLTP